MIYYSLPARRSLCSLVVSSVLLNRLYANGFTHCLLNRSTGPCSVCILFSFIRCLFIWSRWSPTSTHFFFRLLFIWFRGLWVWDKLSRSPLSTVFYFMRWYVSAFGLKAPWTQPLGRIDSKYPVSCIPMPTKRVSKPKRSWVTSSSMIAGLQVWLIVIFFLYSPSVTEHRLYEDFDGQDGRKRSVSAASDSSELSVVSLFLLIC